MKIILQSIYFMLPAYLANMMPVFLKRFPIGNFPIHEKMFGSHKTYRGLVSGALTGILIALLQKYIHTFFPQLSIVPFDRFSYSETALIGLAFGGGILLGDLVKSFFKRRLKIAPGGRWMPFDQLDFLGALFLVGIFFIPPLPNIIAIFITSSTLTIITDIVGYHLGLRDVWW